MNYHNHNAVPKIGPLSKRHANFGAPIINQQGSIVKISPWFQSRIIKSPGAKSSPEIVKIYTYYIHNNFFVKCQSFSTWTVTPSPRANPPQIEASPFHRPLLLNSQTRVIRIFAPRAPTDVEIDPKLSNCNLRP